MKHLLWFIYPKHTHNLSEGRFIYWDYSRIEPIVGIFIWYEMLFKHAMCHPSEQVVRRTSIWWIQRVGKISQLSVSKYDFKSNTTRERAFFCGCHIVLMISSSLGPYFSSSVVIGYKKPFVLAWHAISFTFESFVMISNDVKLIPVLLLMYVKVLLVFGTIPPKHSLTSTSNFHHS